MLWRLYLVSHAESKELKPEVKFIRCQEAVWSCLLNVLPSADRWKIENSPHYHG